MARRAPKTPTRIALEKQSRGESLSKNNPLPDSPGGFHGPPRGFIFGTYPAGG